MKYLFAFTRKQFTAGLNVQPALEARSNSHLLRSVTLAVAVLLIVSAPATSIVLPTLTKMFLAVLPPPAPKLNSPGSSAAPGKSISTTTPTFHWQAASGADSYGLYISKKNASGTYVLYFDSETEIGTLTGTSLLLPSNKAITDGGEYRWNMRAKNSAGWSNYSDRLYFSGCIKPSIPPTAQPKSQPIASGQKATLSVVASGPTPLKYQWYKGASGNTSGTIAGATSSSYITPALTSSSTYWVRVSNSCGSVDSATATITVSTNADLAITSMTALPNPVVAGSNITYKITAKNNGPNAATSVVLTDPISANTNFQSRLAPSSWSCTNPSVGSVETITCTKSSMASAETATFTVVVKVNASTPDKTVISNTATVSSSTFDPNTTNNMATATITVSSLPTITVTAPNGGETWRTETTQTIRWAYTGNPGTGVRIEILKGDGIQNVIPTSIRHCYKIK